VSGFSRTVSHDMLATMRTVRRGLSRIVFVWLICQVSSVTAAPLLLAGQELCTCPTDIPGAACPMHHAHQDPNECVLRNAAPTSTATLASLVAGLGLISPAQTFSAIVSPAERIPPVSAAVILRSDRPDSPPPRS
jgi:hypothetical protein